MKTKISMFKKMFTPLLFLLFSLTILNCGDDEMKISCSDATVTMQVDGVAWQLGEISNTSIAVDEEQFFNPTPGYRLDFNLTGTDGSILSIIVNQVENGITGNCMQVNKTWNAAPDADDNEQVQFIFTTADGTLVSSLGSEIGTFTLTKCDEDPNVISGTFSFESSGSNGAPVVVSDGVFTNVCFRST